MKTLTGLIIAIVVCMASLPHVRADLVEAPDRPTVEIAFVLDTTGSMGGLIAGAKAKIWAIANQIVLGDPKPIVRIALVPYRDKGDEYVTKVFDLTNNIDEVYTQLMKFRAAGGGDGPENVNQALYDAVHKISWSDGRRTLKIIYLVGDYPPHNEYKDVPTYDKSAKAAIEKGIYINTILCGGNRQTREIWEEIAKLSDGTFLVIAQDGGVRDIPTPYDKDLARLNRELLETAIVYGKKEVRAEQLALNKMAKGYDAPAAAARSVFAAEAEIVASNDLVDDVRNSRVDIDKIDKDLLPVEMQSISLEELHKRITVNQARRDEINRKIKELSAKRAHFVKQELTKHPDAKKGFDFKVLESLRVQASRKGITYK